jgi:hypothetical protein
MARAMRGHERRAWEAATEILRGKSLSMQVRERAMPLFGMLFFGIRRPLVGGGNTRGTRCAGRARVAA